jgi:tetratricopeptide (TPR) repeat protein
MKKKNHLKLLLFEEILATEPNHVEALHLMGAIAYQANNLQRSVELMDQAIAINSNFAEAYSNRGNALLALQQPEAALSSYEQAISINPNFADAYSNRGNALLALQQPEAALSSYDNAISLNSTFADAYSNRGIALQALNQFDAAIASYDKAISLNPNLANAYYSRGLALQILKQYENAIENYCQLLDIDNSNKDYLHEFSTCLTKVNFSKYSNQVAENILRVIDQKTIIRTDLTLPSILLLLEHNQSIINFILIKNYDNNFILTTAVIKEVCDIPLFIKILKLTPITDIRYEKALTLIRNFILLNHLTLNRDKAILTLSYAIAHQCFINEYVYFETEEELNLIIEVEKDIENSLRKNEKIDILKIIILASYKPLYSFSWAKQIINLYDFEDYQDLLERQVTEHDEEQKIRSSIKLLSPIKNKASQEVQAQYELNPYPRWIESQITNKPITINELFDIVKLKPEFAYNDYPKAPEILMAGCGTGQNSLSTASTFKNSKLTAIDLSLTSLSYAIRKMRELKINNIEYFQADILDLKKLKKQFDIVESSGVLHHMSNPLAGWEVLVDCTKPNGLMHICLYSSLARKDIIRNRELMKSKKLSGTINDIRFLRNEILNEKNSEFLFLKSTSNLFDFFTASGCRDLFFHAQEHQFNLLQINEIIKKLGLTFLGFEFHSYDEHIKREFKQQIPDGSEYSLLDWHKFELANPNTFISMYQMWLKKNDF